MSLTLDEVRKIAHLARLNLSENENTLYTTQLSTMLNFVAQMDQIDTSQVEPLAHPFDISQRLREDVVTEPDMREKFQRSAPCVEAGLYLVPQVIDDEA